MGASSTDDVLRRRWIRACVVGELVGFVPPAVTGAVLVVLDAPEAVLVVGLVLAGLAEGFVLGTAQSRVLSDALPSVTGWVGATTIAAGLAWLAGMGGSSLTQAVGPSALVVVVPAWIAGLLSMGVLQARCLRPAVVNSRRWIPVTTIAWLVGVALPVAALSVVPNAWPPAAHVVTAVAAAVGMGATVGIITGTTLVGFTTPTRDEAIDGRSPAQPDRAALTPVRDDDLRRH